MPIPEGLYLPFSKLAIDAGHDSYIPQWSKTATCDRLISLIYDEALVHASLEARTQRLSALIKYCEVKRGMAQEWFAFASAAERKTLRDFTFNSALVEFDEGQIGRCGRFDRALTAVFNETVNQADKSVVFQDWLNNLVLGLADEFNFNVAPRVSAISIYRINSGPSLVNTGATINLSSGQSLDMYTTGVGFVSSIWRKNSSNQGGQTEEVFNIASVVGGDSGDYLNRYTNTSGNTDSDTFDISVT